MARLIPKVEFSDISVPSERRVARALVDSLPDNCVVYHSYPWLRASQLRHKLEVMQEGKLISSSSIRPGGCWSWRSRAVRMARLIPKVEFSDISVPSERRVARALVDSLPDNCVV